MQHPYVPNPFQSLFRTGSSWDPCTSPSSGSPTINYWTFPCWNQSCLYGRDTRAGEHLPGAAEERQQLRRQEEALSSRVLKEKTLLKYGNTSHLLFFASAELKFLFYLTVNNY
jgi:hypothetical protein